MALSVEHLSQLLTQVHEKFPNPAIALSVFSADQLLFQEIRGVTRLQSQTPAQLDHYFHMGSCSKSVVAVLAAQLVEQKQIDWHSKLFDIFPELQGVALQNYQNITLQNLLLCQAGIKPYTQAEKEPMPAFEGDIAEQFSQFRRHLLTLPPSVSAKEGHFRFLYSNASYTLAANMLEKVTGKPYSALIQQLAETLDLSIQIGWPNLIDPEYPWGHMQNKKMVEPFGPEHPYRLPKLIYPGSDLSMTPKDFTTYAQKHLQGISGQNNVLTSDSYQKLHFSEKFFSMGAWNSKIFGIQMSGMDGSAGTFFCRALFLPEEKIGFTIMTNMGSATGKSTATEWLTKRLIKSAVNKWWMFLF